MNTVTYAFKGHTLTFTSERLGRDLQYPGHVYRTEPCEEFPGEWLVCMGQDSWTFTTFTDAKKFASEVDEHGTASVCWKCSDGDPRQGEVWFTGFYQHGKIDCLGRYVS